MKNIFILVFILPTSLFFAQENGKQTSKLTLDSIKKTFVNHNKAKLIDEKLLKELYTDNIFQEMVFDITESNIDNIVDYDLSTELLKDRLKLLNAKTPFNIEYSDALENVIKNFLKHRKKSFEKLMSISEYYFPMFEESLAKYNIPLEIKYLAIVESALNPKAKSRVGATGLWQFMYPTGKQFNLEVNSYVDERSDPLKSTEAACQYLSSLYSIFGDWDLVLASYNAGPGNVSKAIRRSGGYKNYWNIRKNLPKETQGYLPAFLATLYIYEYHKEHGIQPKKGSVTYITTDTIEIKHQITFEQISKLLELPIEEIQFLNPIYKLDIIPYTQSKKHYLRLPLDKIGLFISNEEKIYTYARKEFDNTEKPLATNLQKTSTKDITHIVKKGDNLGSIASKYNINVKEIKKWNKLTDNSLKIGQKLQLHLESDVLPKNIKTISNYIVQKGDSLFLIAKKMGVTVENIKKWNDIRSETIHPGMKLKVKG